MRFRFAWGTLPPPQQQSSATSISTSKQELCRLFPNDPGKTNTINSPIAKNNLGGVSLQGCDKPMVGAVVVTLTLKVNGVPALSVSVGGTEQTAPVGVPLQVRDAAPLIPMPPIARE